MMGCKVKAYKAILTKPLDILMRTVNYQLNFLLPLNFSFPTFYIYSVTPFCFCGLEFSPSSQNQSLRWIATGRST